MKKFKFGDVVVRHPEYNKNSGGNLPIVVFRTLDERFIECIEFRSGSIYISAHPVKQYRKIGEIGEKPELIALVRKLKQAEMIEKSDDKRN